MADPATVVGLIASIASLIDLTAKVVSRVHEFSSKTSEVPESFLSLSNRLPLLSETLTQIKTQAQAGKLSQNVAQALLAVANDTANQVTEVETSLSRVLPSQNDSKFERTVKALKSLAKEDKIQQRIDKIHKNIDFLVLYQTTRHIDTGDQILAALTKLTISPPATVPSWSFGVCLGQAPQINPQAFVGRKKELQQLQTWLLPAHHPHSQVVVSIAAMGGMGKTQLSLAHIRQCGDEYTSVFWVSARDETSLLQSMANLSTIIFPDPHGIIAVQSAVDEKAQIDRVRRWLSEEGNDRWLLIFDNYDDPQIPGIRSPTGYDLRKFFPTRSQGSILITSRSTRLAFAQQLRLEPLKDLQEGIEVICCRAGQEFQDGEFEGADSVVVQYTNGLYVDDHVQDIAKRLDGLPLALATAGSYLQRTGIACAEYLEQYNNAWADLVDDDQEELLEYEARTLATTWTVSLRQVRQQDDDAAELLSFVAYLDYRDIWCELIQAGACEQLPWTQRVTQSKIRFQRSISRLQDYNLAEVVAGSFSIHPCLHDWLIGSLNHPLSNTKYRIAVLCVTKNIGQLSSPGFWSNGRRLLRHARELVASRFRKSWLCHDSDMMMLSHFDELANLLRHWNEYTTAKELLLHVLAAKETAFGADHLLTLHTVHCLGILRFECGKLDEAEQMYQRVLAGMKILGSDHILALDTYQSLGALYIYHGRLEEAEQISQAVLAGREAVLGPDHISTLDIVHNLGTLYLDQGKLDKAEQMYRRALAGSEKALGSSHKSTLMTVHNIGILYFKQGRLDEAEEMYKRALAGRETALGPNHISTLNVVYNFALLYHEQDKVNEAERMYLRALQGTMNSLGRGHKINISTVNYLGDLYREQGRLEEAEQLLFRYGAGRAETSEASDFVSNS